MRAETCISCSFLVGFRREPVWPCGRAADQERGRFSPLRLIPPAPACQLGASVSSAAPPRGEEAAVATSRGYVESARNRKYAAAASGRSIRTNVHWSPERPPPKT